MRWEVLNKIKVKKIDDAIDILLKNRGIKGEKEKKEFFYPTDPVKIPIKSIGVSQEELKKAFKRLEKARKSQEMVIVYGDYDADGITSSAIMWEGLNSYGLKVLPYVPDRFDEGYGINAESVKALKEKMPDIGLIVTVDNGIVGFDGILEANKLGIDVIVVDHHLKGEKKTKALAVIHSTQVCGSALSWFFTRDLNKVKNLGDSDGLELAAIGTIADQMSLVDVNRSIVKHGLTKLNKTKRPGLLALYDESGITNVGPYEIGYIIAPRINAMGRLKHGIESLRLLCTRDKKRAFDIAKNIGSTNSERQKIVEEVVGLTKKAVVEEKVIVIGNESYHEGVIGLAAGRLVEEFYRPSIVLSVKGEISKASARSISGFNIIEAIRKVNLHIEGGGHPMAAGFSIETVKIDEFRKAINKIADSVLTEELLEKRLKIDCRIDFGVLNYQFLEELEKFEPTGFGNPGIFFEADKVEVLEAKTVGREARHLKLKLKQDEQVFDSIFFGGGEMYSSLKLGSFVDVVFSLEDNSWNGYKNLQLKIRDLRKNLN